MSGSKEINRPAGRQPVFFLRHWRKINGSRWLGWLDRFRRSPNRCAAVLPATREIMAFPAARLPVGGWEGAGSSWI